MTRAGADRAWPRVLLLVALAPVFGEVLSTATSPLGLLDPLGLAVVVALYGSGALLCREAARRLGLGVPGLLLLGAAYGVYEEALIDCFWFDPEAWHDTGVGTYAVVWHTNVLLASDLTAFHAAVSITATVVVAEALHPAQRHLPWVRWRGLVVAVLAIGLLVPFLYGEAYRGPTGPTLAAVALLVALVGAALLVPRPPASRPYVPWPRPRAVGWVAAVAAGTHFVLVYALPHTPVPGLLGVVLALLPIVVGAVVVLRLRPPTTTGTTPDPLPVVLGVLAFFALLDVLVGAVGRPDLAVAGLVAAYALRRLARRAREGTAAGPLTSTG